MKVGSLFSGIGGFDLGLERAGFEISWQVEIDEYCRQVLKKHWPAVPCHYDIRSIDWEFIQPVDLICGGFPCQPVSCAGKRRGADDERYLWPEVVRCLSVLRPTWFLGENVPGLLHLGIEQVCADLEALGYQVAVLGIPACAVDAPHLRQRVWIVAHARCQQRYQIWAEPSTPQPQADIYDQRCCENVADAERRGRRKSTGFTDSERESVCETEREEGASVIGPSRPSIPHATELRRRQVDSHGGRSSTRKNATEEWAGSPNGSRWLPEPAMGELVNGVSGRLVRFGGRVVQSAAQRKEKLKALGNAIVPQIAEALGRMIKEASCSTQTGRMW